VKVKNDLQCLYEDCGYTSPIDMTFNGGVELGIMAKEQNITTRATVSLAELTATVLHHHLPKDPQI
jgi:hypothetical protein